MQKMKVTLWENVARICTLCMAALAVVGLCLVTTVPTRAADAITEIHIASYDDWVENYQNQIQGHPDQTFKIVMDANISLERAIELSGCGGLIWDLHGYNLNYGYIGSGSGTDGAFNLSTNFTLTDTVGTGALVNSIQGAPNCLFLIRTSNVNLTIAGGAMKGLKFSSSLISGYGEACQITISGGEISGNQFDQYLVNFPYGSSFTMTGGKIVDNKIANGTIPGGVSKAGAIYVQDFTMTGGEIANNFTNNAAMTCYQIDTGRGTMSGGTITAPAGTTAVHTHEFWQDGQSYSGEFTVDDSKVVETENGYVAKADCEHKYRLSTYHKETCTENGYNRYICSICNQSYDEVIPATGHKYGDWIVDVAPTTETEGSRHKLCEICKDRVDETIPKLPTTPVDPDPEQPDPVEPENPDEPEPVDPTPDDPTPTEPATPTTPTVTDDDNKVNIGAIAGGVSAAAVVVLGGVTAGVVAVLKRKQ